jgi:hypothetical protein
MQMVLIELVSNSPSTVEYRYYPESKENAPGSFKISKDDLEETDVTRAPGDRFSIYLDHAITEAAALVKSGCTKKESTACWY